MLLRRERREARGEKEIHRMKPLSDDAKALASSLLEALADCDHGVVQLSRLEDVSLLAKRPWVEIREAVEELIAAHVLAWDETTKRLSEGTER